LGGSEGEAVPLGTLSLRERVSVGFLDADKRTAAFQEKKAAESLGGNARKG